MKKSNSGRQIPSSPTKSELNSNGMLDVKVNRKRAESDLQLLANRIALLRVEEQKALNKVNETKARADEILEIKRRNEEMLQSKIQLNLAREHQLREVQAKAALEREENKRRLQQSKSTIYDSRRTVAQQTKLEAKKLESIAMQGKAFVEQEKRSKTEEERNRREAIRLQRERERQEREQKAEEAYVQKMKEEAQRKREAEEMILLLENEEKELILRLRKTQDLQQEAYSTLQKSLQA